MLQCIATGGIQCMLLQRKSIKARRIGGIQTQCAWRTKFSMHNNGWQCTFSKSAVHCSSHHDQATAAELARHQVAAEYGMLKRFNSIQLVLHHDHCAARRLAETVSRHVGIRQRGGPLGFQRDLVQIRDWIVQNHSRQSATVNALSLPDYCFEPTLRRNWTFRLSRPRHSRLSASAT